MCFPEVLWWVLAASSMSQHSLAHRSGVFSAKLGCLSAEQETRLTFCLLACLGFLFGICFALF